MKFSVSALPARYGDCLWIAYGDEGDMHYILIDGGTAGTAESIQDCIDHIPVVVKHIELIVVTHIDQDHIGGILKLLSSDNLGFTVGDLWFNGWDHLSLPDELEEFGAKQAERLSARIVKHQLAWNKAFDGKAIAIEKSAEHPVKFLASGMNITLLSPLRKDLEDLRPVWEKELALAGLLPGFGMDKEEEPAEPGLEAFGETMPDIDALILEAYEEDEGEANASSIAFIAEYAGKSVLFAGDALPSRILARLKMLMPDKAYHTDLFKISHHGSAGNTTKELIQGLDCSNFLISTSGASYYHPSQSTIARLIKFGTPVVKLVFNYRTQYNEIWDNEFLKQLHNYTTEFPGPEKITTVELITKAANLDSNEIIKNGQSDELSSA